MVRSPAAKPPLSSRQHSGAGGRASARLCRFALGGAQVPQWEAELQSKCKAAGLNLWVWHGDSKTKNAAKVASYDVARTLSRSAAAHTPRSSTAASLETAVQS